MSDAIIGAGILLVVGGLWWMYPPAGVVMAGVLLIVAGILRGLHE